MKKQTCLFCLWVLLLTVLSGCRIEQTVSVADADLDAIKAAEPSSITRIVYTFETEGGGLTDEISDSESINAVHALLREVKPGEKARTSVTDSGLLLQMELNGEMIGVRFEGDNILIDQTAYVAENLRPLRSYLGDRMREVYEASLADDQ